MRIPIRLLGALVAVITMFGAGLQSAFIRANLADRIQRVVTPAHLGSGIPAPHLPDVPMRDQPRAVMLGDDALTEWNVHRTD